MHDIVIKIWHLCMHKYIFCTMQSQNLIGENMKMFEEVIIYNLL